MKRIALVGLLSLSVIGAAVAAQQTLKLTVNGKASASPAIVVNGKTYLPLEALEKAGAKVARSSGALSVTLPGGASGGSGNANVTEGGANQRASLEGCVGETLFNGVWRLKVLKLEAITKDAGTPLETKGWGVTVEWRNGAKGTLTPAITGVKDEGIQLAFADAQTLDVDRLDVQKLTFATLPQGGVVTHQLKFWYKYDTPKDQIKTPVKFLVEIDPKGFEDAIRKEGGASYTTSSPSFRVRLDCQK